MGQVGFCALRGASENHGNHPHPHVIFFQGGSGTEPEPATGTVGTVRPETESGTGTAETQKETFRQRNRKLQPLEPSHPQTVTGPNQGHPDICGI